MVNYVERINDVRRSVYELTLRDGPAAISHPAIAADLRMSLSTLKREVPHATDLPLLGFQWVDRRGRGAGRWDRVRELAAAAPRVRAVEQLLDLLPSTDALAQDARVWRSLTTCFSTQTWARAAVTDRQLGLAILVDTVVPDSLDPTRRAFEVAHLTCLVLGTIEGVCTEALLPSESLPVVRRHLDQLGAAWHDHSARPTA